MTLDSQPNQLRLSAPKSISRIFAIIRRLFFGGWWYYDERLSQPRVHTLAALRDTIPTTPRSHSTTNMSTSHNVNIDTQRFPKESRSPSSSIIESQSSRQTQEIYRPYIAERNIESSKNHLRQHMLDTSINKSQASLAVSLRRCDIASIRKRDLNRIQQPLAHSHSHKSQSHGKPAPTRSSSQPMLSHTPNDFHNTFNHQHIVISVSEHSPLRQSPGMLDAKLQLSLPAPPSTPHVLALPNSHTFTHYS